VCFVTKKVVSDIAFFVRASLGLAKPNSQVQKLYASLVRYLSHGPSSRDR
jgi:hypothetical protein